MPVDQLPRRESRPPGDAKLVRYDEYIDTQIRSTRKMVKVVDLATAVVLLTTGVLAFLLAVALFDHWLVAGGLSVAARTVLCLLLVSGVGYFSYRRLWPLLTHAINPVYAAHTIEEGSPTLKNSLVNLLLFRSHRSEISDSVYRTLEEQAARQLTRLPTDSAVDRSHLIRLGYVLLAVVAVAALYKIISPKDPVIAAERVLMPWADIVPASRVSISAVEPGSVTVSRGEFVTVTAEVRGIDENDPVLLRYSTADGQAIDRAIPMLPVAGGQRFEGRLPSSDRSAAAVGLAQDATYRIEAGDARSRTFHVTVVSAPAILVERVEYKYPTYSGLDDYTTDGVGDIRALEGTRVTIHARANGPISEAYIDFEADGRRNVNMTAEGVHATGSFVLALRSDRQTPQQTSYVLRFTNTDGRTNHNPVKYSIDVVPDDAPEVSLLAPEEQVRDVRLDETVVIELEAIDPDFGLAAVRLRGEATGRPAINVPLLERQHRGWFNARYRFTPSEHSLRAGDVMQYWVEAEDNRTPRPNVATTDRQSFRITSPDPAQDPPPDRQAQRDPPPEQDQQQQQDQPQQGEPAANGEQQDAGGEAQPADGQAGEGAPADGERQENGERQQGGESASADGEQPVQQDERGGPSGERQAQPDEPGQQPGDGDSQQPGADGAHGERPDGTPDGARPDQTMDRQPGDRETGQPNREAGEPSAESRPVSPEGDDDGEAFERIRRHLDRDGEMGERDGEPHDGQRDGEPTSETLTSERNGRLADGHVDGPGAETQPGETQDASEPQRDGEAQQEESPGGQETSPDGPPGAGEQPDDSAEAPDSPPEMKPTDKQPGEQPTSELPDGQEPPVDARSRHESDAQGEEGGDQSGGGQQSEREGTGAAGSEDAAEDDAGAATEPGAGEDSPDAGRDATAPNPTGQPGTETPGDGATRQPGDVGETGGAPDDATGQPGELPSDAPPGDREPGTEPSRADRGGVPDGSGGVEGAEAGPPSSIDGTAPDADPANLEYARKQTDLVLERLADQLDRKQFDEELLDELGWTEDDLRRFVERWRQRKEAAQGDDPAAETARRELDEALQSLGLRPGELQQGQVREDDLRDLREGYRGPVPLEYLERLRAYSEGISRSRAEDE